MADREKVIDFLNTEMDLQHFKDVEETKFNGALVKGTREVEKVGLCTNTTFENIESAEKKDLDLVISHHGGWKKFDQDLLEEKKQRIEEAGFTWYIAHATLDCAKDFGVSWTLAEKLGLKVERQYAKDAGGKLGVIATPEVTKEEFLEKVEQIEENYEIIGELDSIENKKIGVIGGGAGSFPPLIRKTAEQDCDILITGSTSFFGEIYAYEKGITMIRMKETSSEKWGVYRLGEHLQKQFSNLKTVRIEEKNW